MPGTMPGGELVPFRYEEAGGPMSRTVRDLVTGLEWQAEPPDDEVVWEQAKDVCASLELGDHEDWRLPTRIELESLVDDTRANPAVDESLFGGLLRANGFFWSSDLDVDRPGKAWLVIFYDGMTFSEKLDMPASVRCVRWPKSLAPLTPRYTFFGAGAERVAKDERTGLEWQMVVPELPPTCAGSEFPRQLCTWDEADAYCSQLVLGGDTDWRLPKLKEILTLDDPRLPIGDIASSQFGEPSGSWTGTVDISSNEGWMWLSLGGTTLSSEPFNRNVVRCVR